MGERINWIQIAVAVSVGAVIAIVAMTLARQTRPAPLIIQPAPTIDSRTPTPLPVTVYVNGAVREPGVYTLPPNSRIEDALTRAGGVRHDAYDAGINRAQSLQDGMQIFVPTAGEAQQVIDSLLLSAAPAAPGSSQNGKVNINTADSTLLQTVPQVGPATAANIIAHREQIGRFAAIEDIMDVSGIGEVKFEQMKPFITVDG